MEYPIIDTLTNAYIRNGWTGLELIESKNLFNGTYINISGLRDIEGTFTNTNTDSKTTFQLQVQTYLNNRFVRASSVTTVGSAGRFSVTLFNSSEFNSIRIKHNGSSNDLFFTFLLSGSGTYTISINVIDYHPNILGGLIFNEVQIEKGTEATPYEPYSPTTTDIFSRTRLPIIRYFPHALIDSLQRANDGTMTADDVQVLRHYLSRFGIGNIELGRFHAINPNMEENRILDFEDFPIDEIKKKGDD